MDDRELLRRYVDDGAKDALGELVRRHINMVWATAMREMRDPHEAADVTQAVFIVLMSRAAHLSSKVVLGGWLFKVTRFAAADARKRNARRERREQEAASMRIASTGSPTDPTDQTIAAALPVLNDAVESLSSRDRDLVLLKFAHGKSHGELAQQLGISENTARQRLFRAIGKLRSYFSKRGINVTDGTAGAILLRISTDSLPSDLTNRVIASLHTGSAGASAAIAKGAIDMIHWTRIRLAAALAFPAMVVVLIVGVALVNANVDPAPQTIPPQNLATSQPASQPAELRPKDVVLAGYNAALRGDAQGMIDCFDRLDDEQAALIKQVANVFGSLQELNSAVSEKFGPQMADQFARNIGMGVDPKEMRDGTETITGRSAIVDIGKSGPGKVPLVKVGQTWKISSEVLKTMNQAHVAKIEQMVPVIQGLAADVRDGKYTTPQQLQQAMTQMMQQMGRMPR